MGFTPRIVVKTSMRDRTPMINHALLPFIENKRYRTKPG